MPSIFFANNTHPHLLFLQSMLLTLTKSSSSMLMTQRKAGCKRSKIALCFLTSFYLLFVQTLHAKEVWIGGWDSNISGTSASQVLSAQCARIREWASTPGLWGNCKLEGVSCGNTKVVLDYGTTLNASQDVKFTKVCDSAEGSPGEWLGMNTAGGYGALSDKDDPINDGEPDCSAGNPVNIASGNKYQKEKDYLDSSLLSIIRSYNSNSEEWTWSSIKRLEPTFFRYGVGNIGDELAWIDGFYAIQDDGKKYTFTGSSSPTGPYIPTSVSFTAPFGLRVELLTLDRSAPEFLSVKYPDGSTEFYPYEGYITRKTWPDGSSLIYTYQHNRYGHITQAIVTEDSGRSITYNYETIPGSYRDLTRVANAVNPDGQRISYTYNSTGLLEYVVYPDADTDDTNNPRKRYHYENTRFPKKLTGVTDENDARYAKWDYDTRGRANYSSHFTSALSGSTAEEVKLNFDDPEGTTVESFTNEGRSIKRFYHFYQINGERKVASIDSEQSSSGLCAAASRYSSYDNNGFKDKITDFNGNVTDYDYNEFGLPEKISKGFVWADDSRTSLLSTPNVVVTEYDWDEVTGQLLEQRTQELTTTFHYGPTNRIESVVETDQSNHSNIFGSTYGRTKIWSYAYTYHDENQTQVSSITVDGPLNPATQPDGFDDVTVYTYNAYGQLTQTRNAYGHVIRYQDYLNSGKPQTIIDANNVVTRLVYTPRGWLDTVTVETSRGNAITNYDYYLNGLLQKVTLPNGASLTYEYNDAKHLTTVVNNLGERIDLTPSLLNGEWTDFAVKNSSGTIIRLHQRVQDELGRVKRLLRPDASTDVEYWYDGEGNLDNKQSLSGPSVSSPTIVETDFNYNALNQLSETVDARNASTKVDHNGEGEIASVTDARNNKTTYVRDGFGQVIRQQSPDTGTTDFWYDAAGNLLSKRDGRGVTTSYTYDALNRPLSEQYSNDSSLNVTLQYDQTTVQGETSRGIGRLAAMLRAGANVYYVYDDRGNVAADIHSVDTITYSTRYVYDRASMLETMTYPSGRTYIYAYDTVGRIKTLSVKDTPTSTSVQLARSVTYEPFGPLKGFIHRNNIQHDRLYDTQGRLRDITEKYLTTTYQNQHFDYDWAGNIERVNDLLTPANSQVFGYSEVDRLLNASGSYGVQAFTYDLVGNRQTANSVLGTNSVSDIYTIASASNRLSSHLRKVGTAAPVVKSFAYNGAGNATTTSTHTITYDGANRIKTARKFSSTTLQFTYNALGQRIKKWVTTTPSVATHFHYDLSGKLIAETNASGASVRDYVWLGDQLVAIQAGAVASTARYSVHSNHLNAPVLITNSSRGTVWKAEYEPYGTAKLVVKSFANNLRFPGQYFDSETGLHYNYFRDYDPALGRYLQSDPIGLRGGINTYAYVLGNPIKYVDPNGLWPRIGECEYFYPDSVKCKKGPVTCSYSGGKWSCEGEVGNDAAGCKVNTSGQVECSFEAGPAQCDVRFDKEGNVSGEIGPSGEYWDKTKGGYNIAETAMEILTNTAEDWMKNLMDHHRDQIESTRK